MHRPAIANHDDAESKIMLVCKAQHVQPPDHLPVSHALCILYPHFKMCRLAIDAPGMDGWQDICCDHCVRQQDLRQIHPHEETQIEGCPLSL